MLEVKEFKKTLSDFICEDNEVSYYNLRAVVKGFQKFKMEVQNQLIAPENLAIFVKRLSKLTKYCSMIDEIEENVVRLEWFLEVAVLKDRQKTQTERKVSNFKILLSYYRAKITEKVKKLIEMLR